MNRNRYLKEALDWAIHIVIAVVIALLIVKYVAQVTEVIGSSMFPTLQDGNRLVMEKISTKTGKIQRGDIIVIEAEKELESVGQSKSHSPLIKRVIGIAGDRVQVQDGKVYLNGKELNEPYINGAFTDQEGFNDTIVPENKVFFMGDNREKGMSLDSRKIGPLELNRIVGRVFVRILPFDKMGSLNSSTN